MKLKSIRRLSVAAALAIAPLTGVVIPGVAHAASGDTAYEWVGGDTGYSVGGCTTNCWSDYKNWKVGTVGGSFAAATSGQIPTSTDNSGAGDVLYFDNSSTVATTSTTTMVDDISNLKVESIATEDSGTASTDTYSLTGNALTITGGIPVTTDAAVSVANSLTFSGNQSIGEADSYTPGAITATGAVSVASGSTLTDYEGESLYDADLSIASGATALFYDAFGNVSVPSGATLQIAGGRNVSAAGSLTGSGNVVLLSPSSGPDATYLYISDAGSASSFSGSFDVQKGTVLDVTGNTPANALGSAQLTIENGGQLEIDVDPTSPADSATVNIANTITMGGNGAGVDQMSQGAVIAGLYDQNKQETAGTLAVNFTGNVTLSANTSLASEYATAATYNFTGTLNKAGHTFSAIAEVQPTYGATTVQVNGSTVAGGSGTSKKAPGTPDTGFALTAAHSWVSLTVSIAAAGGIWLAARRVKPVASKQRGN